MCVNNEYLFEAADVFDMALFERLIGYTPLIKLKQIMLAFHSFFPTKLHKNNYATIFWTANTPKLLPVDY